MRLTSPDEGGGLEVFEMLYRDAGRIIFHCDACGDEFVSDRGEDFDSARSWAKLEGWIAHKDEDGDWVHGCPVCGPPEL